ncbi:short-chain fatty acyl-CoA regulator family protein [Temperatibacter marinus]|uniref:Short-chain fatty acyl-CoA regulator family protein n=1 Tax=Temperatibacter marinus TaxID=1456591 RepID=A0AA52HBA1_9PROT|nr:short-chain fatty acyl-CoA regulator family protein [Temperatibacter marinus]WND03428.1 short-chain fatty acyl-CoA regulator family protein [Temperatibacter marinus]
MDAQSKIFAGPKIRRLRRELGLSQSRMASELGFSTSYLNLVERDQRPVSAQFLLRLAEVYDLDLATLAGSGDARAFAEVAEILSDPLFKGIDISKADIQDSVASAPQMAEAMARLYRAYQQARERTSELSLHMTEEGGEVPSTQLPNDQVRDFLQNNQNYFPELDEAAELLSEELGLNGKNNLEALGTHLELTTAVRPRFMPTDVLPDTLRHFDRHRRQLMLSEMLTPSAATFQIAYLIGLLNYGPTIDLCLDKANFQGDEAVRLAKISLANYFAGALLMPYSKFHGAAENLSYDIEHLAQRFGTSFEQAAHRLTTLQRPGKKGIAFFFLRVDAAGNVSKRFSAGSFPFSKFGGTCPLWNVHESFVTPGKIHSQMIEMPDETRFFSVARTVERGVTPYGEPRQRLAVALVCDLKNAAALAYAKGHNLEANDAAPVGPNCRLCERPSCAQRAHPPLSRKLVLDERSRGISAYNFEMDA